MRFIARLAALVSFVMLGAAMFQARAGGDTGRGKYLVTVMGCNDCHTPGYFFGKPDMARSLGGSEVGFEIPASNTSRAKWFTPACARQDLRALSIIEERGEGADVPAEWLADAGLKFLQARLLCLSGQEDKGVALYQSIIDFEALLLNASKTIERVRP
jgi:hypothetical protein